MPDRLVLSFRGPVPADLAAGEGYLRRALTMKKRAGAHGATLCAWSAWTFSFAFSPDDLEEALGFAELVFEQAPEAEGFCVGIAEGEMRDVGEGGSLAALSWGMPLVTSVALSRAARAGEVLLDDAFFARHAGELAALGFQGQGDRMKRLVRASAARDPAPSLLQMPADSVEPERLPASMRQVDPLAEMAKKALLQGDTEALEKLITKLRDSGTHDDLVERMSGFVALRRGATADALRRLRAATEAVKEPAQRARARLAYGVALASAGRTESALLEALEALARAREARDPHGEHACALFLARLSAAAGHPDAASAWAIVASKAEAV
jgi:hypothetical protein